MKKRILTGDRPTGRLHLGHYVGSLKNRVKLQEEYEAFFIIADLHTLTTRPQMSGELKENIHQLVLDYLSVGIDSDKSTIYVQSQIPEVSELAVIFGNLMTVPRLERVPTLKDVMRDAQIQTPSYGLLGYPVLQSADILMVRAHLVPVGRDQASHIEITREIAREFNRLYRGPVSSGSPSPQSVPETEIPSSMGAPLVATPYFDAGVFPIPEALIPDNIGTLPGTDGRAKMSKSAGNVINLSDSPGEVKKKVMGMFTDPKRVHGDEPGRIEGNPVFTYLDSFSQSEKSKSKVEDLKKKYKEGTVKDIKVKEFLVEVLEEFLEPIREKRAKFEKQPGLIDKILKEGTEKARVEAKITLDEVRRAMKINYW